MSLHCWIISVHLCHMFIVTYLRHFWFDFNSDETWGKSSHGCIPAFRITLIAHWGTTITAQNKVPYLILIGPDGVFIIRGGWNAFCCFVKPCFERHPSSGLWSQSVKNSLFWSYKRLQWTWVGFFFTHHFSIHSFFPGHCWEFLLSLLGLSDFISWPTLGTLNIYPAPGREVCCWLPTRQTRTWAEGAEAGLP